LKKDERRWRRSAAAEQGPFRTGANPFDRPDGGRRRLWWIAGGVALLLLVAGGAYLLTRSPSCASGGVREGGECIGVTDGSYDFDPKMRTVDQAILRENRRILKDKNAYVTVAFLGALSVTKEHNLTGGRVPREVEGAYIGQMRVNNGSGGGDNPKIRLVLANEGSDQSHWPSVVHQLEKMVTKDHLVAVVGLGLSNAQTVRAARDLSSKGIAMVGDVITGDGIDSTGQAITAIGDGGATGITGLTRVAPSVQQEVSALAKYLKGRMKTAAMVVDQNATDLYSRSLATDFRRTFAKAISSGARFEEPFTVDSPDQPGINNRYAAVATNLNLCGGDPPDVVLYAGRTVFLPGLLRYLEHCRKTPIRVVTGSDAAGVSGFAGDAPATVLYTALADPDQLNNAANKAQEVFRAFLADCSKYYPGFKPADLRDGWAIMAHDSVLTAAQAIRLAAGPQGTTPPTPKDVSGFLYNLHSANHVDGASGQIDMGRDGNPAPHPIPVVELSADGTRKVRASLLP
jgi:hypothetical protein